MNTPFIISLITNIILFLLILSMLIYIFSYAKSCTTGENVGPKPVAPVSPVAPTPNNILTNFSYAIKTVSGRYVQSCFQCLATPVSCFEQGIVASQTWNSDTYQFIPIQATNYYNIKVNVQVDLSGTYFLVMVPSGNKNTLCLTQNPNQKGAVFELLVYANNTVGNIYQIGSVQYGSLLGESLPSCLVTQGLVIHDGFNTSPNAPNGMNERSFFLILPSNNPTPKPNPIAPEICEKDSDCQPNQKCMNNKCTFSLQTLQKHELVKTTQNSESQSFNISMRR